jgi:hypothetical protein
MYATLRWPREATFKVWAGADFTEVQYKPKKTWGQPWRDAGEQQRMAYIELMGKEPPEPSCEEARAQFEYGTGRYRTKAARAANLAAASNSSQFVLV